MPSPAPIVSVIIPCYNGSAYVDRTLLSVRSQSVGNIQIIIVDDGSVDESVDIINRHRQQDDRIILLQQGNSGVAIARNHGAKMAEAPFLAFLDADDLWAEDMLKHQLELFEAHPEVGLVYSWNIRIDADDTILEYDSNSIAEGDCLDAICKRNFIGNGSAAMIRRELFLESGGFDPGLRQSGAEGCEDYDLYARLAAKTRFGLVRHFDIGYRITAGAMSSHQAQMVRSRLICSERLRKLLPEHDRIIRRGRRQFMRGALRNAVLQKQWSDAAAIAKLMLIHDPVHNIADLPFAVFRRARTHPARKARRSEPGLRFAIGLVPEQRQPERTQD